MSTQFTFEKDVANFRGGTEKLTLATGERDGLVTIGLSTATDNRMCLISASEAQQVVAGLNDAIKRATSKKR